MEWIGLLVGNPFGWLGYPPWRVPPQAWEAHRQNRMYTPGDYQRDRERST